MGPDDPRLGGTGSGRALPTVLLAAVLTWFTLALALQLSQPLWWDELFTFDRFISGGPLAAITTVYHPNNHRLFTLTSATLHELVGGGEAILRLPSMIAGGLSAWMLAFWIQRRHGGYAALAGMLFFCLSPILLIWVPQARGYGFVLLAATALLIAAHELAVSTRPTLAGPWLWCLGLSTATGMATLPHFVLLAGFTAVTILALRGVRAIGWEAVAVTVASVALGTAIYLPGLASTIVGDLSSGTRGSGLGLVDAVVGPFRFLVLGQSWGGTIDQLVGELDVVVAVAIAVLFFVGVWSGGRRPANRPLMLLCVVPVFGIFALFSLRGMGITDRTLLFLLPHLAVGVSVGVSEVITTLRRLVAPSRLRGSQTAVVLGVLVCLSVGTTMISRWLGSPIEDYRSAVAIAVENPGFAPVTDTRYDLGLRYYDRGGRFQYLKSADIDQLLCERSGTPVAYLYQPIGRVDPLPQACLDDRGAARVRVSQRTRGYFEVWFVP